MPNGGFCGENVLNGMGWDGMVRYGMVRIKWGRVGMTVHEGVTFHFLPTIAISIPRESRGPKEKGISNDVNHMADGGLTGRKAKNRLVVL